jgi:hypothetical protein
MLRGRSPWKRQSVRLPIQQTLKLRTNYVFCRIKEFIRRNGGEILEDLEGLNGFSWVQSFFSDWCVHITVLSFLWTVLAYFDSLLRQAGSAVYQGSKIPDGIDRFEYYNLMTTLAPNESGSPDDKSEWNLINEYLDSSAQALDNPHDLSFMLQHWQNYVVSSVSSTFSKGITDSFFIWMWLASSKEVKLNEVQMKQNMH